MNSEQREIRTGGVPNRSRFHRSALDKLPDDVKRELGKRCASTATLKQICEWLAKEHSLKIGISAVSEWWRKRIVARKHETTKTVEFEGFEIVVTAPGAESITVRVTPFSQSGVQA